MLSGYTCVNKWEKRHKGYSKWGQENESDVMVFDAEWSFGSSSKGIRSYLDSLGEDFKD